MPYVGILTSVLGYVSTEHYSYQELFHEVNIQTGGIASSINVYGDAKEYRAYTPVYTVRAKALYGRCRRSLPCWERFCLLLSWRMKNG